MTDESRINRMDCSIVVSNSKMCLYRSIIENRWFKERIRMNGYSGRKNELDNAISRTKTCNSRFYRKMGDKQGYFKTLKVGKVILITAFLMTALSSSLMIFSDNGSAYTSRSPIYIEGDSNFTVGNGVTGGSGTALDPFIISGWEINTSTANGIEIRNTTAHFSIQNVYIYSGTINNANDAIRLYNITSGRVNDTSISYYATHGIYIENSDNCTIINNTLTGPPSGSFLQYGVMLQSSNNMVIAENNFSRVSSSISLYSSNDNGVYNNNFSTVGSGVVLSTADNITISGNYAWNMTQYGIAMWTATHVMVSGNNLSQNGYVGLGIYGSSSNVTIDGNNLSNCAYSIYTQSARDLTISNNNISSGADFGIAVDRTINATVSHNILTSCGINIWGFSIPEYNSHTITTDNSVNGKPTYYYKDSANLDIDGISVGQLIVVNYSNVSVANLDIGDIDTGLEFAYVTGLTVAGCNITPISGYGIYLRYVYNVSITDNNISNGNFGIYLRYADNCTFANNIVLSHYYRGMELYYCTNANITGNNISNTVNEGIWYEDNWRNLNSSITYNTFYNNSLGVFLDKCLDVHAHHNNFINNTAQALDNVGSQNDWDDGYPSGGNYWNDYSGWDNFSGPGQNISGSDGIGDTPYIIDVDSQDDYPLMGPFNTAPNASFEILPSIGNLTTAFIVNASSCSDAEDPTEDLEIRLDWEDNGSWDTSWSTNKTAQYQYSAPGNYTVRLEVKDTHGLSDDTTRPVSVVEDPPITVAELSGTAGNGVWFVSAVIITLNATDDWSGINWTYYAIDGGSWQQYSTPFEIVDDGNHTLDFYSQDLDDNTETERSIEIKIDTDEDAERCNCTVSGTIDDNNWYISPINITLSASDSISGVNWIKSRIQGEEWQLYSGSFWIEKDGIHTLEFNFQDIAGNEKEIQSVDIKKDGTAPILSIDVENGTLFDTGLVDISWSCYDRTSGIAHYDYSLDARKFVSHGTTLVNLLGLSNGTHSITIRAFDQAGNMAQQTIEFEVNISVSDGIDGNGDGDGVSSDVEAFMWTLIGIIAIFAAAVVTLLFYFLRLKKLFFLLREKK